MAHIAHTEETGLSHRLWTSVVSLGQTVSAALAVNSSADARFREVQRLQSLSDVELSKLGIPRDRIVHHVFRDIYLI